MFYVDYDTNLILSLILVLIFKKNYKSTLNVEKRITHPPITIGILAFMRIIAIHSLFYMAKHRKSQQKTNGTQKASY